MAKKHEAHEPKEPKAEKPTGDKELDGLIADAGSRKAQPGADGMTFIDWHNAACDLVRKRHNGALADAFNKARKDDGSLAERFDASVKALKHVIAEGEMPKVVKHK